MFSIICALDSKNGFAHSNSLELPWKDSIHSSTDLKFFKEKTQNNVVIYGRKTFESLKMPHGLPDRINIVITSDPNYISSKGLIFVSSIENALNETKKYKKTIFVIGGKNIVETCISSPLCERVYISRFSNDYKCDIVLNINNVLENNWKITDISYAFGRTASAVNTGGQLSACVSTSHRDVNNLDPETLAFIEYHRHDKIKTDEMQYLHLVKQILEHGEDRNDRTGTGTRSLFGQQIEFDLSKGFPLLTSKSVHYESVVKELLWMLRGETDSKILEQQKVNIWKGNTSKEFIKKKGLDFDEGELGKGYGHQWRNFGGKHYTEKTKLINCILFLFSLFIILSANILPILQLSLIFLTIFIVLYLDDMNARGVDQIKYVMDLLRDDPYSRRIRFSGWNPVDLDKCTLPPCHCSFDLYIRNEKDGRYLDGKLFQRSCDVFLGLPFNIASYATLIHIFCKMFSTVEHPLYPGKLYISLGDSHIYKTHIEQSKHILLQPLRKFPTLTIHKELKGTVNELNELLYTDFEITKYDPHPSVKAVMAV